MEQNKKIIISVRVDQIDPTSLANYSPHGDSKCFEVYKMMLLKEHITLFDNEEFKSYLKGLKFINQVGKEMLIFPDNIDCSKVFNNDNFKTWIENDENTMNFIKQLIKTNDKHLIRKHNTEEIYVVPVLNEDFNDENVEYTEKLIEALKKKDDDLWLLLHDKDLYNSDRSCHLVKKDDDGLVPIEGENRHELNNLVEGKRLFVFRHESNADYYYDCIVLQLDDEKLTSEGIVKRLDNPAILLAEKLGEKMMKKEIEQGLSDAPTSISYDFSKQFLEL